MIKRRNKFRYHWERIYQTLFTEEADERRNRAKEAIREIRQIIDLCDKQRSQGFLKTSTFAPLFKASRDNANGLHGVLKNGWNCCCTASHKVMPRLERKVDRRQDEFNMLCVVPSNSDTEVSVFVLFHFGHEDLGA